MVVERPRDSVGKGVALIEDAAAPREWAAQVNVLYVHERLPGDRDLRMAWVRDRMVAVYWLIAAKGAFHNYFSQGSSLSFQAIPDAALALLEQVASVLAIDHAGFDVAMVDGHPFLLGLNVFFRQRPPEPRRHPHRSLHMGIPQPLFPPAALAGVPATRGKLTECP